MATYMLMRYTQDDKSKIEVSTDKQSSKPQVPEPASHEEFVHVERKEHDEHGNKIHRVVFVRHGES